MKKTQSSSLRFFSLLLCSMYLSFYESKADVGDLPFSMDSFAFPTDLISDDVANAFIKTIGLATDFKPYRPATPLGTSLGLELALAVTAVKFPKDLYKVLRDMDMDGESLPVHALPVPLVHINKGLSKNVDLGLGGAYYKGYWIFGSSLKATVYAPTEGPTWAIQMSYARSEFGLVQTRTYTPQVMISKELPFTDPYLGVGYQVTRGRLYLDFADLFEDQLPEDIPEEYRDEIMASQDFLIEKPGGASSLIAFLGLGIRFGPSGAKMSVESSYSSAGMHSLGVKVGLNF
jgi:hypothetical protein